jgi:periplasmic divalent cation tolerance protein
MAMVNTSTVQRAWRRKAAVRANPCQDNVMIEAPDTGLVTTTVATRDDARRIADALLADRLAACVQLLSVESHYVWKGERMAEGEIMLLAKTRTELFDRVIARIKDLHPYETPEIVAQKFHTGFAPYLAWIMENTGRSQV